MWSGLLYGDEIFDDIPCGPGGCSSMIGATIAVVAGQEVTGRNFDLDHFGTLAGHLVSQASSAGLNGWVYLRDSNGVELQSTPSGSDGSFGFDHLWPGSYYLVGRTFDGQYLGELFDGIPCPGASCPVTGGTPIAVGVAANVGGVVIALGPGPGITGHVTVGGAPTPGVGVDAWSSAGLHVANTATDGAGAFYLPRPAGGWYVSTDSAFGAIDQVNPAIPCPFGSAWSGHCDPTSGAAVTVVEGPPVGGIDFALALSPSIFRDGLESGHVGSWSVVLP
jgi:hypothetical protein